MWERPLSRFQRAIPLSIALFGATAVSARQDNLGVRVTLSIRGGQTTFKTGETIRLVASFAANGPDWGLDTHTQSTASLSDRLIVSPSAGVLDILAAVGKIPSDTGTVHYPLGDRPQEVTVVANQFFRFDRAGDYQLILRTKRAQRGVGPAAITPLLETNAVSIHVVQVVGGRGAGARRESARRILWIVRRRSDALGSL